MAPFQQCLQPAVARTPPLVCTVIIIALLAQTAVSEQAASSDSPVRRVKTKVDDDTNVLVDENPGDFFVGVRRSDDRSQLIQSPSLMQQRARFVITSDLIADLEYRRNQERLYVLKKVMGHDTNSSTIWLVSWTLGWVLCCIGSLLSALGYVLMKYSHVLIMRKDPENVASYFLQGWWLTGFGVWLSAEIVNVLATALAPQALLPLPKSWTITCLVAISRLILGEEVGFRAFAVMTGLLCGSSLIAMFAPVVATPEITFERPGLEVAAITTRFVRAGSICGVLAFTSLLTMRGQTARSQQWKYTPFLWASFAAFCAGCTQTLLKCVVVLTMAAPGQALFPTYPASHALLVSALLCGIVEVHSLNLGLRMGDAVLVLPVYLSLSTVSQVLLCGIIFDEIGQFASISQAGMFGVGALVLLGCVWLVMHMPASMATWQMREVLKA